MPGSKNGEGTLAWLRDRNRQRVMEILRMHGQISQADIARATGLSRTTVSTLVSELKEAGLVADIYTQAAHAHGGRAGRAVGVPDAAHLVVRIQLRPMLRVVGGVDLRPKRAVRRWCVPG